MGFTDTFGIALTNMIKTNNKMLDSVIIIMIPILVSYAYIQLDYLLILPNMIIDYINSKKYIRWNIDDTRISSNGYYNVGSDFHNNSLLREAIMIYLGELELLNSTNEIKFIIPNNKLDNYKKTLLPSENKWVFITSDIEFKYNTSTILEKDSVQIKRNISEVVRYVRYGHRYADIPIF